MKASGTLSLCCAVLCRAVLCCVGLCQAVPSHPNEANVSEHAAITGQDREMRCYTSSSISPIFDTEPRANGLAFHTPAQPHCFDAVAGF